MALFDIVILRNWLLILAIPALIVQRDAAWMAIVLVGTVVGLDLRGAALQLVSIKSGREVLRDVFPREKSGQILEEIPTEQILDWLPAVIAREWPSRFRAALDMEGMRARLGLRGKFEKAKIYIRSFDRPPFDHVLKAFPSFNGTSFIFLRDPVSEDSKPFERFKFYHEVAHITVTGMTAMAERYSRPMTAALAVCVAIVCCNVNWIVGLGLVAFLTRELLRARFYPIEFEAKADLFAMFALQVPAERERVVYLLRKAWSRNGEPNSVEYGLRLLRLDQGLKELVKHPNKRPIFASWNAMPGTTTILWFGLLIWTGIHSRPLPTWPVIGSCIAVAVLELVFFHAQMFAKAARIQRDVEEQVWKYAQPSVNSESIIESRE